MNFNFLKLKNKKVPPLRSFRPPVFDVKRVWYSTLGICGAIFLITTFVGLKIFYSQYFETYKKSDQPENYDNLIDIKNLNRAIEKRNEFINKPITPSPDPSV